MWCYRSSIVKERTFRQVRRIVETRERKEQAKATKRVQRGLTSVGVTVSGGNGPTRPKKVKQEPENCRQCGHCPPCVGRALWRHYFAHLFTGTALLLKEMVNIKVVFLLVITLAGPWALIQKRDDGMESSICVQNSMNENLFGNCSSGDHFGRFGSKNKLIEQPFLGENQWVTEMRNVKTRDHTSNRDTTFSPFAKATSSTSPSLFSLSSSPATSLKNKWMGLINDRQCLPNQDGNINFKRLPNDQNVENKNGYCFLKDRSKQKKQSKQQQKFIINRTIHAEIELKFTRWLPPRQKSSLWNGKKEEKEGKSSINSNGPQLPCFDQKLLQRLAREAIKVKHKKNVGEKIINSKEKGKNGWAEVALFSVSLSLHKL